MSDDDAAPVGPTDEPSPAFVGISPADPLVFRRFRKRVATWVDLIGSDVVVQLYQTTGDPVGVACCGCGQWVTVSDTGQVRIATVGEAARLFSEDPSLFSWLASPVTREEAYLVPCQSCEETLTAEEWQQIGQRFLALVAAAGGEHLHLIQRG